MSHPNQRDNRIIEILQTITQRIEREKPSRGHMLQEIKMMNFKVKPISGDIFSLPKKDIGFVESLWKLGKIEEMISEKLDELEESEKDIFFNYLDDLQYKTQQEITREINKLSPKERKKMNLLELEIFKDGAVDHSRLN